jgi:hypothetical protein
MGEGAMLTVADLIEKLQRMPGDATVFVGDDDNIIVEVIEVGGDVMLITDKGEDEDDSDGATGSEPPSK